jgi:hypothetical protein
MNTMSTTTPPTKTESNGASLLAGSTDLFARTLRTVAVLVGACILFVGTLSTAAVLITSKAMGPSAHDNGTAPEPSSPTSKKPLAI